MKPLAEYEHIDRPIVIAHRGSSGTAPENTMSAIRQGVEAGADMVEIDVQETVEGSLIVFHDSILGRTTNGSGKVEGHTYKEIAELDAGSWMDEKYSGERIPLLADALGYLHGKAYVNIELKRYDDDPRKGEHLLRATIDALRKTDMTGYAFLSSFDHELLALARSIEPTIPYAVIMDPHDRAMPSERALPVNAKAVVLGKHQLSHDRVRDAVDHNLLLALYTINTEEEVDRMLQYGVQIIVTNFPRLVMNALDRKTPSASLPK